MTSQTGRSHGAAKDTFPESSGSSGCVGDFLWPELAVCERWAAERRLCPPDHRGDTRRTTREEEPNPSSVSESERGHRVREDSDGAGQEASVPWGSLKATRAVLRGQVKVAGGRTDETEASRNKSTRTLTCHFRTSWRFSSVRHASYRGTRGYLKDASLAMRSQVRAITMAQRGRRVPQKDANPTGTYSEKSIGCTYTDWDLALGSMTIYF